jgi:hypothetical protein
MGQKVRGGVHDRVLLVARIGDTAISDTAGIEDINIAYRRRAVKRPFIRLKENIRIADRSSA